MKPEPQDPLDPGPRIGDLVVVPYPAARERLGLGPEVGIQIDDRRNVVHICFPGADRILWIPREQVQSVELGRLPTHPVLERLHMLSAALGAERIEIGDEEAQEPDIYLISFPGATLEALVVLRDRLGADVLSFGVEPGSMRRVRLRVRFAPHLNQGPLAP